MEKQDTILDDNKKLKCLAFNPTKTTRGVGYACNPNTQMIEAGDSWNEYQLG